MKRLCLFILSCFLTYSVYSENGNISETSPFIISDTSTTVDNPFELTFSPDGGVADDGDGSATVNLDTALNGTFLELDGSNANTTINIGSENLTTTGAITSGDITIFDPTPVLIFKDSNSLGAASVGFIEWRDSGGGRAGFLGNNSSGNDDLFWKNEQGGNIGIQTTGEGEVQIFGNVA